MEKISRKTVVDTIESTKEYIARLNGLVDAVQAAEDQVTRSGRSASLEIDITFDNIQSYVQVMLETRRKLLQEQVVALETRGLDPLKECKRLIKSKLESTNQFLEDALGIVKTGGVKNNEQFVEFFDKSSQLGSLPAVPDLETVPDIQFHVLVDKHKTSLVEEINNIGKISKMGPVQISVIGQHPGSLLITWEEADVEFPVDNQRFRLQMTRGDVRHAGDVAESTFDDVYTGAELQFLVRNLESSVPYTFRVCCYIEQDSDWSAWSLLKVACTSVDPYCWTLAPHNNNNNYLLTNGSKVATKLSSECVVLYSKEPLTHTHHHSVEFTVVECPGGAGGLSEEGLALTTYNNVQTDLVRSGSMFLNTLGNIYIDGVLKLTVLPRFKKGSKITFNCESLSHDKLRVNIDNEGKAVTYDWTTGATSLYFAVLCLQKGFQVAVA